LLGRWDIIAESTTSTIEFLLNGRPVSLAPPSTQTTLLDLLRDQGLTGAKEGCAEGECGACMVILVAGRDTGSAYRAVNSCLMLAPMAAGQEVYTVEALAAGGELNEVQRVIASGGGSQCGYCTPGFVMSLFAEHYRPDRTGPCQIDAMGGNLCRCTGYRPIRDAAISLGRPAEGLFLDRLARPAPRLDAVHFRANGGSFERPATLAEAIAIAAEDPTVRWIAGATDLGVESNLRFRRWSRLVSVEAIPELLEFSETPESVRIGAALPLSEMERLWTNPPELVRQWWPLFASAAIRNRATLGGNLATASPIGDGAPMLLALDASLHLAGPRGSRTIPLAEFFTGYRRSALEPGELIVAVEIPKPYPGVSRFYKVAKRRMDDISTITAAFSSDTDERGRVTRVRFAFGGVAATPLRISSAEEVMPGERWNRASVERVQAALDRALKPMSDHRGSAEYRREAAKSLVEKFCWEQAEAA
jgi:xanthine dehydrogenase small subunit